MSTFGSEMELRTLSKGRRFTETAVIEARGNRDPLRTEVVRDNKTDSYYCRACRIAESGTASGCRHIAATRRFVMRAHLAVVK